MIDFAGHLHRLGYLARARRLETCTSGRRCRDNLCTTCMLIRSGVLAEKLNCLKGSKLMATLTFRKPVMTKDDFLVRRRIVSQEFKSLFRKSWAFLAWEYTERLEGGLHAHVHSVIPDPRGLREIMGLVDGHLDVRDAYNTNELVKYMTAAPEGLRWLPILGRYRRYATYGQLRGTDPYKETIFNDLTVFNDERKKRRAEKVHEPEVFNASGRGGRVGLHLVELQPNKDERAEHASC